MTGHSKRGVFSVAWSAPSALTQGQFDDRLLKQFTMIQNWTTTKRQMANRRKYGMNVSYKKNDN